MPGRSFKKDAQNIKRTQSLGREQSKGAAQTSEPEEGRSTTIRSVYSNARRKLTQKQLHSENSTDVLPAIQQETEDSVDSRSPDTSFKGSRISFKEAARAFQLGARDTLMCRSMMTAFKVNAKEHHEEEQGLVTAEQIEERRKSEEDFMWRRRGKKQVEQFTAQAGFLTSLLEDLKSLRAQQTDTAAPIIDELMKNMHALTLKMNALKGLYAMDRRNCVALNKAIEITIADVQKRFARMGDTMRQLTENFDAAQLEELGPSASEDVEAEAAAIAADDESARRKACELRVAILMEQGSSEEEILDILVQENFDVSMILEIIQQHNEKSTEKLKSDDHEDSELSETPQQSAEDLPEESSVDKPISLWRKAKKITVFGNLSRSLLRAAQEFHQTAGELGHASKQFSSWGEASQDDTTPGGLSVRSLQKRNSWNKVRRKFDAMSIFGKVFAGAADGHEDSSSAGVHDGRPAIGEKKRTVTFGEDEGDGKEQDSLLSTADTSMPSSAGVGRQRMPLDPPDLPRRRPWREPLMPRDYPSIGASPTILPMSVETLTFKEAPRDALEKRLTMPFPLIPMVPTSRNLPPLKEQKLFRRAMKVKDSKLLTAESVRAERESRGLRKPREDVVEHAFFNSLEG